MRVLLVGATGAFGSRLAARLAGIAGLDLVLAARSNPALARLRAALATNAAASLSTAIVDRRRPDLSPLAPDIVIDAAGPFQDGDMGLARASIAASAHFIDLADARFYVAAFPALLDDAARTRGVLAVTGARSTPALSHAVLDDLVAGWSRVDRIVVAILPGARAPRGLSVIQAILSWVGHPVRVFVGGDWREWPGWSGLRRLTVPGLGRRFASLCETPDLDLLPTRFAVRDEALFLAGLEVPVMHLGLWLLSVSVRLHLVSDLRPLAGLLRAGAGPLASLGSDAGGMVVEAAGLDGEGRRVAARWSLVARDGCGPAIPGAAAAALVRALYEGRSTRTGATACVGLLDREAILAELVGLPIETRTESAWPNDPALFRRLLGRGFEALPPAVRSIHGKGGRFAGRAVARTGRSLAARALRRLLGLPVSGRTDIRVDIEPVAGGEIWTRSFGTSTFRSRLFDLHEFGTFEERFGPLAFRFGLMTHSSGVEWRFIGWRVGPVLLPRRAGPRVLARGEDRGGLYGFTVVVAHPLVGLVVAYRGTLDPTPVAPQPGAESRAKGRTAPM